MKLTYSLSVFLSLVATTAFAQAAATGAGAALHALFDREWEWELTQDPLWASYLGDRRWNDKWPDVSAPALAARQAHRQAVIKELSSLALDQLSPADRLNYDLFRHQYQMTVEGFQHRQHLIRTSTLDGVQNAEFVIDSLRFQTVKDFDDWLARLDAFPAYMDQNIALMREGMKSNVLLPKIVVQRVREQIVQLTKQAGDDSGYYRPFRSMPAGIGAADRERLAKTAVERIRTRVQPAFARLLEFLDREYLPVCYDGIGWWRTSGGLAGYRYFARYHTTTELAPQDIHALGLKEVARIRAEMEAIKKQLGFTGTLEQFFTHLRTDPKFFYKTGGELLEGYRSLAKRIDPELIKITRKLPRVPYGVIPIPDAIAPMSPTAYANGGAPDGSRPAYFFANLHKPETRPKWEMMALTLHEAMPGHCLQISVAQELGELPQFRRHAFFTAYVEGWGLYAESLGEDMGLYKDDLYLEVRPAYLRNVARRPTRRRYRHPRDGMGSRSRHQILHGQRGQDRERRHQRGRSLYLVTRTGARVQDGRAENQGTAAEGPAGARREVRSTRLQRRGAAGWRAAAADSRNAGERLDSE